VLGAETSGGSFSTLANTSNLDLHQGYLELDDFLADGLTLQAGRFEVSLGSERLVGAVGWHNVGRSFDGIRTRSVHPFGTLDVFVLNTGETTNAPATASPAAVAYVRDGGQFLGGLYASLKNLEPFLLDVFALYESNAKQTVPATNDLSRLTIGGYGRGSTGSVWYQSECAYQFGSVSTRDLGAYLISGTVGLNLSETGFQRFGMGADILSGTSLTTTTENNTFVPAFHTGHKFYGFMDYFVGIPAQGLHDYIATARFQVDTNATLDATGHFFRMAQSGMFGKDLGAELDLVAAWRYNQNTLLQLGVSVFQPGGVMKSTFGGSDMALWGFAVVQVSI